MIKKNNERVYRTLKKQRNGKKKEPTRSDSIEVCSDFYGTLDEWQDILNKAKKKLPKGATGVLLDFDSGYDNCTIYLKFQRPETYDEMITRKAKENEAKAIQEEREREAYERLKKKYG